MTLSAEGFAENIPPAVPAGQLDAATEAKGLFERGNYREAEMIYERILKAAPDNFYVLSKLGLTQFRQQKLRLAEETLKKALVIDPKDEFCLGTLGIVCYQQKRFDEATRALTRALIINPDNVAARDYLSLIASRKESGPSTVAAGAKSPEDTFLSAYLAFRTAENLEQNGPAGEALLTYKKADEALAELSQLYPEWNPAIVEFRRSKIAAALKRLQP
jgi:tetratricopeptide (TPR) repeat protein